MGKSRFFLEQLRVRKHIPYRIDGPAIDGGRPALISESFSLIAVGAGVKSLWRAMRF